MVSCCQSMVLTKDVKTYLNFMLSSTFMMPLDSIVQGLPAIASSWQSVYSGEKAHDESIFLESCSNS